MTLKKLCTFYSSNSAIVAKSWVGQLGFDYKKCGDMIIAVDFDGTCVKHRYPMVGEDVDGAVSVLKELVRKGHKIILYTMRGGDTLDDAISWFIDNDIELWGINRNPEQYGWSLSPKVFANLYIDDAALGIPLIEPEDDRDYVDWNRVRDILITKNVI